MIQFGIKDALDVVIVAAFLFWLYKLMKQSGTKNIFLGVLAFIVVWLVASEILGMRLTGTILDKFMSIGLLVLVIIFQEQIKRFLEEVGSHRRWRALRKLFHRRREGGKDGADDSLKRVMPIVYACMNMARSRTGALIVIEQVMNLESYEKTGDMIDANINSRLIENIFFKNSPLHDGAMIIAHDRIMAPFGPGHSAGYRCRGHSGARGNRRHIHCPSRCAHHPYIVDRSRAPSHSS